MIPLEMSFTLLLRCSHIFTQQIIIHMRCIIHNYEVCVCGGGGGGMDG